MSKKDKIVLILKILVATGLVWYLFYSGNLSTEVFFRLFQTESLQFIFLSAVFFCIAQFLSSVRLLFLLRIINIRLTLHESFRLTMIGNFFNIVIPGAVGGDVVKGYYLAKMESDKKGRSAGILITDRILGLMALLIISFVSLAYLFRTSSFIFKLPYSTISLLLWLGGIICVSFIAFVFLSKRKGFREWVKMIANRLFKEGFVYFIIEGFGSVTKKRRYLFFGIIISILIQLLCLLGVIALTGIDSTGFGNKIALMAVSSVVMLLGVVPVSPGNIGWTELMASYGWSLVGGTGGAQVFLFWRVVTILCSLPGAFFYLLSGKTGKEMF